jgi:hypothetical protein
MGTVSVHFLQRLFTFIGLNLEVEFTPSYPQEMPKYSILVTSGKLSDPEGLNNHVLEEAKGSIGMAMIYTLVSSMEDWLSKNCKSMEDTKASTKESIEAKEVPISLRGGPVTQESFAVWNEKYMEEIQQATMLKDKKMAEVGPSKLTGRQLFEHNKALVTSDAAYGDEADIVVNEVLFEGLDDLDIEDFEYDDDSDSK